MALPSCVVKLDHWAEDPPGTIYKIDATNKAPAPGYNIGTDADFAKWEQFRDRFLEAIQQTPRPLLTALLHGPGHVDVTVFSDLSLAPHDITVALVDLTDDTNSPTGKLRRPHYVNYHDRNAIYPASLLKMAAIYAAHQLKFDLQQIARGAPSAIRTDPVKLKTWLVAEAKTAWQSKGLSEKKQPNVATIVDVASTADPTTNVSVGDIIFTKTCAAKMNDITHPGGGGANAMNGGMAFLTKNIRGAFMGSAFLQSGLCQESDGGLWWWDAWGERWTCGTTPPQLYPGQGSSEFKAWSAATMLTLLAQERLVSPAISRELKAVLLDGDTNFLYNDLSTRAPSASITTWGKHGAYGGFASEAGLVERVTVGGKTLRYVVVCFLSSRLSKADYPNAQANTDPAMRKVRRILLRAITELIIPALDTVIALNNP
jgi:hypothetical protein